MIVWVRSLFQTFKHIISMILIICVNCELVYMQVYRYVFPNDHILMMCVEINLIAYQCKHMRQYYVSPRQISGTL